MAIFRYKDEEFRIEAEPVYEDTIQNRLGYLPCAWGRPLILEMPAGIPAGHFFDSAEECWPMRWNS